VRVLPDWDFGSMEVNALFANGKTIKPAARAFADFLLRELRTAEDGSGQSIAVTARHSPRLLIQYLYPTLAENLTVAKHAPPTVRPRAGGSQRASAPCA
jgi:hypothetical protein